jgi:hypothetical protein
MVAGLCERRTVHIMAERKQREEGGRKEVTRTKYLQEPIHSDLLLPARSHFLKFPEPSKIVALPGTQAFNIRDCEGHFLFNQNNVEGIGHQEDTVILNVYLPNKRVLKYPKQKLMELKK